MNNIGELIQRAMQNILEVVTGGAVLQIEKDIYNDYEKKKINNLNINTGFLKKSHGEMDKIFLFSIMVLILLCLSFLFIFIVIYRYG